MTAAPDIFLFLSCVVLAVNNIVFLAHMLWECDFR
jgi:hypothetical protein